MKDMNDTHKKTLLGFIFLFIIVYLFITLFIRPHLIETFTEGFLYNIPINVYTIPHLIFGIILGLAQIPLVIVIAGLFIFEAFEQVVLVGFSIFHAEMSLDTIMDLSFAFIGYLIGVYIVSNRKWNKKKNNTKKKQKKKK